MGRCIIYTVLHLVNGKSVVPELDGSSDVRSSGVATDGIHIRVVGLIT